MPKRNDEKTNALASLFPGRVVNIQGVDITVHPLGVSQIRKFSEAISKLVPTMMAVAGDLNVGESDDKWARRVIAGILPFAMSDLISVISDCCDVDIDVLPQWAMAPVVEAWLEESFGTEDKIRPWKDLAQTMMRRFGSRTSPTPSLSSSESEDSIDGTLSTTGQSRS